MNTEPCGHMQVKGFSGNSVYHILASATNTPAPHPTSCCYLAEMLAHRLAGDSNGTANIWDVFSTMPAWGCQGRLHRDYNRFVTAFHLKREPCALSDTNPVVINCAGEDQKRRSPFPQGYMEKAGSFCQKDLPLRKDACVLYAGLAERKRKRCCE